MGATNDSLCKEFVATMQGEFEMSMIGVLSFFLGLQVQQSNYGIFLIQPKYCKEILKKFEMKHCKETTTLMSTSCCMDDDTTRIAVDQSKYRGLIGFVLYLTANRLYICLQYASVLDSSSIRKNHTLKLPKEF